MSRQVVTIGPDGAISGLAHKQGFDLRALGKVEIERVSEVVFDTPSQLWFIKVLRGPWAGTVVDTDDWCDATGAAGPPDTAIQFAWSCDKPSILGFNHYHEAVLIEVALLDALRLKGVF